MKLHKIIILFLISLLFWNKSIAQRTIAINIGHAKRIVSTAFSPDGKYLLSSSEDKTIKLWDNQTGFELYTIREAGTNAIFSPDGKTFATIDYNKIRLWDTYTRKQISEIEFTHESKKIIFNPNGKQIAAESPLIYNTIGVWNIKSGNLSFYLRGNYFDYSPDGSRIIYKDSEDRTIIVDAITGKKIKQFSLGFYYDIKYGPDGKKLLTAYYDQIYIYDSNNGRELNSIQAFSDRISPATGIKINPNGKTFSARRGDSIKIWDYKSFNQLSVIKTSNGIWDFAYSSDGNSMCYFKFSTDIMHIDINTGKEIKVFQRNNVPLHTIALSPDGKSIVEGNSDGLIRIWGNDNNNDVELLHDGKKHTNYNTAISINFSPDGNKIIYTDKDIQIWNRHNLKLEKSLKIKNGKYEASEGIYLTSLTQNNKYLLAEGRQSTTGKWRIKSLQSFLTNVSTDTTISSKIFHRGKKMHVAFSPNNHYIGIIKDSIIELLDVHKDKKLIEFKGHSSEIEKIIFSNDDNYLASISNNNLKLWNCNQLKEHTSLQDMCKGVTDFAFSPNNKTIALIKSNIILLVDIKTGTEKTRLKKSNKNIWKIIFSPNGNTIATINEDNTLNLWNIETWKMILSEPNFQGQVIFGANGTRLISTYKKQIKIWNTNSGKLVSVINTLNIYKRNNPVFSNDGNKILVLTTDGTLEIYEIKTGKLLVTLVTLNKKKDYVVYSPNGRFDGTEKGMKLLCYVEGMDIIPLSSLYEQYFTPNLLARIMAGEKFKEPDIKTEDLKLPPQVQITNPIDGSRLNTKIITIKVKTKDQGGGVDEIRLYHNGKLVENTQRGFDKTSTYKSFKLSLIYGENYIKATAFNKQRTESIPDEIIIYYDGPKKTANLHMLVVGINQYRNPKYRLNYAIPDATAFKQIIEKNHSSIFGKANITYIKDTEVTRKKIMQEFTKLKTNAKQEDVFIFYYAGHGVMSMENKSQFYIIPYDVTKLYGNNEMLRTKAISATELQTFSKDLKAQKQVFIFDACQSGGMTELLASRGAAEEKAIAQLARSTGTYWLTASGSDQFATEFKELGHGVFTYAILQALSGQADSGNKDKKITVKELSSYLDDKIPELSEKYKGEAQFPSLYGYGMDFPIIIVK